MNDSRTPTAKWCYLSLAILGGLMLVAIVSLVLHGGATVARAEPIDPPEGYPKLKLSVKTVTPTLASTGGTALYYTIEIYNTGAYTAAGTTLTDILPGDTTYNDDLQATVPFTLTAAGGTLTWEGDVGFDSTVVVSFSVSVSASFSGTVRNTAVISHPLIMLPVTMTVETIITDQPILTIGKTSTPPKPGANQPLFYTITVANQGQPAANLSLMVTDQVPDNTTLRDVGPYGVTDGSTVTWTRSITLGFGAKTTFTFSVDVGDVPSGTVIINQDYRATSPESGVAAGKPYTVTIIDPILLLSKETQPDPPGSNRETTYILSLLNVGSLATDLVITDRVPAGVEYRRGGSEAGGIVSWTLPSLDTYESAQFTYTVYISDVMNIPIANVDYVACAIEEGVCAPGDVLTSVVQGPVFEVFAMVIPIAKKPGGEEVTPTLKVHNVGHGNAISATVVLTFYRMSLTDDDVVAYPPQGAPVTLKRGPDCGDKCRTFPWIGDIGHDEWVTFTVPPGISTIGGEEGNKYVATVIITDALSNMTTPTATAQAEGKITHMASVVPYKSAPPVIGRGQLLTYTIRIANHAFNTDLPPVLTDTIPLSTTFVHASDGGVTQTIDGALVVSWTLPLLGPGDEIFRTFTVLVDYDLVSGTLIINSNYEVSGYGNPLTGTTGSGLPVTTTVKEVGLIDSYKEVTPTVVSPGPGNVLTYYLHIVNSGPLSLTNVTVYDLLPWQSSTYQRDTAASAGEVVSDIVSIQWTGDVAPFSSEIITFTVLVDPDFRGAITNTAVISHPDLLSEVRVQAVAYVTDEPILRISKSASPDPVSKGANLYYTILVTNLGQQATSLVITDTIPENTDYVAGGQLVGNQVQWEILVLKPGESRSVVLLVTVTGGREVVNAQYGVTCAEGIFATGEPVVTRIRGGGGPVHLPMVLRNAP